MTIFTFTYSFFQSRNPGFDLSLVSRFWDWKMNRYLGSFPRLQSLLRWELYVRINGWASRVLIDWLIDWFNRSIDRLIDWYAKPVEFHNCFLHLLLCLFFVWFPRCKHSIVSNLLVIPSVTGQRPFYPQNTINKESKAVDALDQLSCGQTMQISWMCDEELEEC